MHRFLNFRRPGRVGDGHQKEESASPARRRWWWRVRQRSRRILERRSGHRRSEGRTRRHGRARGEFFFLLFLVGYFFCLVHLSFLYLEWTYHLFRTRMKQLLNTLLFNSTVTVVYCTVPVGWTFLARHAGEVAQIRGHWLLPLRRTLRQN